MALAAMLAAPLGWAADAPPLELKFSDFFAHPIGPRGLVPSAALRAAAGQRVRITGYMVAQEDAPAGRFFLTPRPVVMSEHADGDADDLPPATVVVFMPGVERDLVVPHTPGLLALTGTLLLGREELADGRVCWVRLLLEPPSPTPPTR